jgi:hypothetical protein
MNSTLARETGLGDAMSDEALISPFILLRRQRTLARVHKHRAKKRAEREAAKKAIKAARRVARRAALEARRARLGLPMPGTPASRQKAYRQRRKAKGLDPYPRRELAEMAARKAIESAKYENRIQPGTLEVWFAEPMDRQTALTFIREQIVPAQPQIAEKYLDQIAVQCRRFSLAVNRHNLRPDGIENARIFRALVWQQYGGKYLVSSWEKAQHLGPANLPTDPVSRDAFLEASQMLLGDGETIRRDKAAGYA